MRVVGAVLASRVAAVCEQLDRTEQQLSLPFVSELLEPDVANALGGQLADCRTRVRRALGAGSDKSGWSLFAIAEEFARGVMAEVFALVQGGLFSSAGLDDGIAAAARRLLEEVRRLCSVYRGVLVTFSPDPESVDHTIGLVRLRFPGTTVWDLPFAIHEFGHHAVRELPHIDAAHRDDRPLHALVGGQFGTGAGIDESHVNELIADVFATVGLGATYPVACILLRVNAEKAATDSTTHPSWQRRVATMVATLERMSQQHDDSRYAGTARGLVLPAWQSLTGDAAPEPADAARLKGLACKVVEVLARHAPKLAYDDKDAAVLIKQALATAAVTPGAGPPAVPPAGSSCAAIVDAAWRWRRQNPDASQLQRTRVDAHAVALCTVGPTDQGKP